MAKVVGLVGAASGKIGNLVYAVTNGIQTARVYQPIVSNPKSQSQRLQRAKGNLVGQISKITPYQILTGLGQNKRARRSRFLRLSLKNATALVSPSNPSEINAKLDIPNFVFSEGAVLPAMSVSSLTAGANSVAVTVTRLSGISDAFFNASGLLVVVVVMQASGVWESILYRFVSSSELTGGSFNFSLPHINEGVYTAYALAAPFSTQDGNSLRAVAGSLFGASDGFAANMEYNPAALPLVWGVSQYVRDSTYTPA